MPRSRSSTGSSPILHRVGFAGAAARFTQRSYAADYMALGFLVAGWLLIQIFVSPFHRMFSLDNKSIQYPFAVHERVPVIWAVFYAGVIPFLIILAWSAVLHPGAQRTQVTILGLLVALMLTSFLTDIVKIPVGRPRPDLLSRCKPSRGTPDNALVAWTVCTETNQHVLQEGWRSFPSGHSSFSFGGLGYLSLFFCGQMHVFRPRTDLGRCLLAFIPLLCALLIAISRLDDYRHDVWDVTIGSLLGLLIAWFSYRRYYPALQSARCDVPYDKGDNAGVDGFGRLDDEEQGLSQSMLQGDGPGHGESYPMEETGSPRVL
ncbi:hypothetical protein N7509_001560 [Penicillium cosmopolitanum]|uniref:Phosphatidic acid phosphatase type 2/haloperoxidase domain-containing protein n=1 Tax=Penicillium cosmopolitanum TaxID=1131564 RepID=A0A9W9W7C2_9EURO|nr:uncharacterized protein N7509_001560 [Penicillium cosmopolitanum]KAJ5407677.1 hypothetical protein N7509_001560 [Penicillium cosmopolitanum]